MRQSWVILIIKPRPGLVGKNVRNAVNSSEKKFPRKAPAYFYDECSESGELLQDLVFSGEIFIFIAFSGFFTNNKLPYSDSNLSCLSCQQLRIPLRHLSITSIIFLLNLNQIRQVM